MKKILLALSLFAALGATAVVYAGQTDIVALCKMFCAIQMRGLL